MKQSEQEKGKPSAAGSLKERAEAAKAKARESLKNPVVEEPEIDEKTLAKGKAVHKK